MPAISYNYLKGMFLALQSVSDNYAISHFMPAQCLFLALQIVSGYFALPYFMAIMMLILGFRK